MYAIRSYYEPQENHLPSLDITLSSHESPPPEEAEYLAQTSQDGGGNVNEKVRAQESLPAQAPADAAQEPAPVPTQVLTTELSSAKVEQATTAPPETDPRVISASELIERSMEMATLSEQINESRQAYAKKPKQVFVSARTQEFKYANYMLEWVKKRNNFV